MQNDMEINYMYVYICLQGQDFMRFSTYIDRGAMDQ